MGPSEDHDTEGAAQAGGRQPTVLLDLDGTLVDTTYLHVLAWWHALDEAGEGHPMSAIHPLIGMGGDQLLRALLGREDEALAEAHGKQFQRLHPLVRALPGADRLLTHITDGGGRAVLVTSSSPGDLSALLAPLAEAERISGIVHAEDADRSKPAPDLFEVAKERYHLVPERTLAVGDAVWDVQSAGQAGFRCVGLLTGGINREDLLRAGAVAVYPDSGALSDDGDSGPLARLLAGAGGAQPADAPGP